MAHKLDKHYSDFGGLDTRSNRLTMDPKTCREGSKNWRYDFNDQLARRYGFQHKVLTDNLRTLDIFEYKFRDLDTGESVSQVLRVCDDGKLYRKIEMGSISLTFSQASPFKYFSVLYDEVPDSFRMTFYDEDKAVILSPVTISETMTLSDLATDLAAFSGLGLTVNLFGDSTALAYLLDCIVMEELDKAANDVELMGVWEWKEVLFPESTDQGVPFPTAVAFYDSPDYEGVTWQNLNNVIYITDGGFLMKYDGKAVYRTGVPKTFPQSVGAFAGSPPPLTPPSGDYGGFGIGGFGATQVTTPLDGTDLPAGTYKAAFRFGFRDANGAIYYGSMFGATGGQYSFTTDASQCGYISIPSLSRNDGFAIYSCKVDGAKSWGSGTSGPYTFSVDAGHNIEVGMSLMIPAYIQSGSPPTDLATSLFSKYFAAKVTGTTATTITVSNGPPGSPGDGIFSTTPDNCVLNAYYPPIIEENKFLFDPFTLTNGQPYGFFVEYYRSKKDTTEPLYYNRTVPMPRTGEEYGFFDFTQDDDLIEILDEEEGQDLPRACRYIADWQLLLVQAGRPYDSSLANGRYPGWIDPVDPGSEPLSTYSEAHLCDYQSIYWNDPLTPEGFPQSGAFEESIDSQFNDEVRGIIKNKDSFFAFKEYTTCLLTGTPATGDIQKEILEGDVGTVCHKVLKSVNGGIVFLHEDGGFYAVVAGRIPEFIGYSIQDTFQDNSLKSRTDRLLLRKARAENFKLDSQYICYIPSGFKESEETSILPEPSPASAFFVLDFAETKAGYRGSWLLWQDVQANGGILYTAENELLIASSTQEDSILWKQKRTNTRFDYTDHKSAIPWVYNTAWLTMGEPTIDKHWVRVWMSSILGGFSLFVKQYGNFLEALIASIEIYFPEESDKKTAVKKYINYNRPKLSGSSIGFENSEKNQDIRLNGFEIEWSGDFDSGEPKQ